MTIKLSLNAFNDNQKRDLKIKHMLSTSLIITYRINFKSEQTLKSFNLHKNDNI